ncbi:MAG: RnfABCDGE type electron transport complex subunit D [Spirochaetaceae bacterium]|jgi:electron transport complex protein RnfD|nr:RnfABCDGE type electron transport complex subunit D [Spirochaetaceae bacterium]
MKERDITLFERPLLNFSLLTTNRMALIAIGALLVTAQSALSDGGFSFVIAAASLLGAVSAEFLLSILRRKRFINDLSAAASGLVLALMLPNAINPLLAFFAAFFSMAVVKGAFGGLGSNWINPAAAGFLFARFSWEEAFNEALAESPITVYGSIETVSVTAEPFLERGLEAVVGFFNKTVFQIFSCEIPFSFTSFLASSSPDIIAGRGVLALLVAGAVILANGRRIMLFSLYMVFYLSLVKIAGALGEGGGLNEGDMFYCLFSGGTLVAAFFLTADPASGPKSYGGKVFAVLLAAAFSFIFRYISGELYGAFFAVLLVNALCPLIRDYETNKIYRCSCAAYGKKHDGRTFS